MINHAKYRGYDHIFYMFINNYIGSYIISEEIIFKKMLFILGTYIIT